LLLFDHWGKASSFSSVQLWFGGVFYVQHLLPLDGHIFREGHGQIAWGKTPFGRQLSLQLDTSGDEESVRRRLGQTIESVEGVRQLNIWDADKNSTRRASNDQEKGISFGDIVKLVSIDGAVTFDVELEDNPHNRHLMKDYEQKLLGKRLYDEIQIAGHLYRIEEIEPMQSISS
jgi:hypothetical protein